jgi:undecaprenyl-diphosphatase
MEEEIRHKLNFNYAGDRQRKYLAFIILLFSAFIFSLTFLGLTNGFSGHLSSFLLNKLGYTNQWSTYYGPEWFVDINKEISALGGFPLMFIFITVLVIYYHLRRETRRLWRLLFVIVVGGLLLFFAKTIFAQEIPDEPFEIMTNQISSFPSGHAMMGAIFYITLAVTISRRQHSGKTKRFTLITGIIITLLIGISRILPGIHTLKDVLAGWSLGLIWLCLCWILDKKIKKVLEKDKILSNQKIKT